MTINNNNNNNKDNKETKHTTPIVTTSTTEQVLTEPSSVITEQVLTEPPFGSWASVARMMAQEFPESDIDWDAWKDEMKESDYNE